MVDDGGFSSLPYPVSLASLAHPTPSPPLGDCTFQIDIQDGLFRNDIKDVNDRGGVNDSRGALAGSLHALLIQNVSFQQRQLDLALELCVKHPLGHWQAF